MRSSERGSNVLVIMMYVWPSRLMTENEAQYKEKGRETMENQSNNQGYEPKQKNRSKLIQQVFETYPVLKQLEERYDHLLSKQIYFRWMEAGESMSAGESGCEDMIFILQGSIKITKLTQAGEETNLYNIGKGEFCHEYLNCLLSNEPLFIVGKVVQTTLVAAVPFTVVQSCFMQDAAFLTTMYQDLHRKLSYVIEAKEKKLHSSLEQRILTYLLNRKGNKVYATHKEIALETDAAREAVSRKLKELEAKGYIRLGRGNIEIRKDLSEFLQE